MKLIIDEEFQSLIPALPKEDFEGLLMDIQRAGCIRDNLKVWKKGDENILLDGHNRLKICKILGYSYKIEVVEEVVKRDDAVNWIVRHQLHRHNLSPQQRIFLAKKLKTGIEEKAKTKKKDVRLIRS